MLDYSNYTIENGERYCLQSSPMVFDGQLSREIGAVRSGRRALVLLAVSKLHDELLRRDSGYEPGSDRIAIDRTEVIFDFYFADVSAAARERNLQSVDVGERIQQEDVDICESVQRGLNSRAYQTGRLSVRREAGEHLFHRLLHADLKDGLRD